ncbi:MAG: hypothetical protein KOO66_08460 [Bacteroidales bacterium]|nr:hypothetical protein [Bacteroidales bacterium]
MQQLKSKLLIIIFLSLALSVKSQTICDTLPFINCDANEIIRFKNDSNTNNLIQKLTNLKSGKNESVQIVHIGDSHLQAGFLTEKIKQQLFQYYSNSDTIAAPGFIFPYAIAKTNNPFFFKVDYTGTWDWCKNTDQEKNCSLGLSGITVRTKDSIASICIKMQNQKYNDPLKYYFNHIKILHNTINHPGIKINGKNVKTFDGYSSIELQNLTDSFCIEISQQNENHFELYGIILGNSISKINYHSIGVNGATAQSYLQCDYFSGHLQNINPDLVIISLGTNEAYDDDFSKLEHEYILKDLIYQIQDVSHNAAILIISANDHLKNREFANLNIQKVNDNIVNICKELNLNYWDFYNIMGGENSIIDWYEKGLTSEDKLHLKRSGYEIQGELFFKAFINMIENNNMNVVSGPNKEYKPVK